MEDPLEENTGVKSKWKKNKIYKSKNKDQKKCKIYKNI